MTNSENVALRRKLLEALHTAPQKMETTDKQNIRYQGGEAARHKQNSGSPQGDSLARNEAPPKTGSKLQNQINNRKKPAAGSILDCEQKMQDKYAFSFDHREDKDGSMMSHSSKYGSQKNERKKIPLDSPNKQFPGKEGSDARLPQRLPSHKKETKFACPPSKAKKAIRQKSKGFPKGSSDDTKETTESPNTDSPCSMELEAEKYFSQSLMEEKNARSSKEQHERLRLLHGKFKEEINQQILDCRTTIEELDAYQLELKGAAERQRATHRKFLKQAEEAMKTQLNDADTCILAVTKEATHKMCGLKQVLDEWIAEGEVC